jgi:erythromycin esterase-like protein
MSSSQNPAAQLDRRSFLAGTTALGVAALTSCASSGQSASSAGAAGAASSAGAAGFASVDEWIARAAISYSSDSDFDAAVDRMMESLGDQISVLGFGEALHGGEEHVALRNRFFQRLVEAHGYSAITLEISDTRARLVDAYISGRGPATYEEIQDEGFDYGAGRYVANRELVEWLKRYNADPAHAVKINFYGTLPSNQGESTASPRRVLELALTYLQSVDAAAAARHREIMEPLLGADADWEGPSAAIQREMLARLLGGANAQSENPAPDPALAFGISPRAQNLRLAVENLDFELRLRQPELVAQSNRASFNDALHDVAVARNLLALHAALARRESIGTLVSMRDAMAGKHLVYISERETARGEAMRGRVLVHLHNAHLRRTRTTLPWYEFLPTGAHLDQLFGARFAVIGGAVGMSEENFIGAPEAGSLEARLLTRGADCFLPTWRGRRLPEGALAALPVRSRSARPYITYEPLTPQWVADLDGIAFLRSATHTRGMPAWPG